MLPFFSLFLSIYLFVIRPCLYRRRSIRDALAAAHPASGLATLPLLSTAQPQPQGKGRKGAQPIISPTVNLIVDPMQLAALLGTRQAFSKPSREERREARARRKRRAFRAAKREAAEAAGDEWASDTDSSSSDSEEEDDGPTDRQKQVAMHKWAAARSRARKLVAVEVVVGLLWIAAAAGAVAVGGTCAVGGYEG